LIYPPNRPNKNQFYFFFQEIFVFVWPIRGVNQNKNILQGVNQNKNFTGGKPEMIYITGGKDLLTPFNNKDTTFEYIIVVFK